MGAIAASRAVVVMIGAALVVAGAGFAGYAIMLALLPLIGPILAAAAAAAALLAGPLLYLGVAAARMPRGITAIPPPARPNPDAALLTVLAEVARDKPILAVLGATLLGASTVLLKHRR